jgi:hypothetical protein
MTTLQYTFASTVMLAGFATILALLRRGRYRECWSYLAYVCVLVVSTFCILIWPQHFYRLDWWLAKRAVFDAIKISVAIELALRAVSAFPGARARMRVAMLASLGVSAAMIASGPAHREYLTVWTWQPLISNATIWIFAIAAMAVVHYRLPVTTWHRAIVLTFTLKLLVFTVLINVLEHTGWRARPWVNVADGATDVLAAACLAYFAWRPAEADVLSPAIRTRLQMSAA